LVSCEVAGGRRRKRLGWRAYLLSAIGNAGDVGGDLAHAGAVLLEALVCSSERGQVTARSTCAEEGLLTHLAEELADGLVDGSIVKVEERDDSLGLGLERHCERYGSRGGGFEERRRILADGLAVEVGGGRGERPRREAVAVELCVSEGELRKLWVVGEWANGQSLDLTMIRQIDALGKKYVPRALR
jgi:hypothetical protein